MDSTEWVAIVIVIGAGIWLGYYFFRKKDKKGCCAKGCPVQPKKDELNGGSNHE